MSPTMQKQQEIKKRTPFAVNSDGSIKINPQFQGTQRTGTYDSLGISSLNPGGIVETASLNEKQPQEPSEDYGLEDEEVDIVGEMMKGPVDLSFDPRTAITQQPVTLNDRDFKEERKHTIATHHNSGRALISQRDYLLSEDSDFAARIREQSHLAHLEMEHNNFMLLEQQIRAQHKEFLRHPNRRRTDSLSSRRAPKEGSVEKVLSHNNSNSDHGNKTLNRLRKYEHYSLFIFDYRWKFRQAVFHLITWKYYDQVMIFSILGNSLILALMDYQDADDTSQWNQNLNKIDHVFTGMYILEGVLKIIAFGFVMHKRSYLRKPWNAFDFTIVCIGLIQLLPSVPNLKAIRTLRVLRPLRTINAAPSMKRLVTTLLLSLPQMGYLVFMLLFFITVFAILGMQIFARDLYKRCRLTDEPILDVLSNTTVWTIDLNQQRLCGGMYECNSGTFCHGLIERNIPLELDKVWEWEFVSNGIFHFDNIGVAILSIFRVITLEGWSTVMYNYIDSSGFYAAIYFPFIVVVGSFFLLKLFLAVIMETFSEMSMKHQEEINRAAIEQALEKRQEHEAIDKMINVASQKMSLEGGVKNLNTLAMLALGLSKNNLTLDSKVSKEAEQLSQNQPDAQGEALTIQNQQQTPSRSTPKQILFSTPKSSGTPQMLLSGTPKSLMFGSGISPKSALRPSHGGRIRISQAIAMMTQVRPPADDGLESGEITAKEKPKKSDPNAVTPKASQILELNVEKLIQSQENSLECSPNRNEVLIVPEFKKIALPRQNSIDVDEINENSHIMRQFFNKICHNKWFTALINASILTNTVCLGFDSYPANVEQQKLLDAFNIVFFCIFFLEMVIKVIGLSPKVYIRDSYNIFDAGIVTISIIDVFVSLQVQDQSQGGRGPISAMRAFRLMRVFKLSKSWKKLRNLIQTIVQTLQDISSFSILLLLLIFIYVLLGMELFAMRKHAGHQGFTKEELKLLPRYNFNTFFSGFIVIFTVLTGESWDQTMFQFALLNGHDSSMYIGILFFISFIIIGVMIFLNLFLAILLENFAVDENEEQEESFVLAYFQKILIQFKIKAKKAWHKLIESKPRVFRSNSIQTEMSKSIAQIAVIQSNDDIRSRSENPFQISEPSDFKFSLISPVKSKGKRNDLNILIPETQFTNQGDELVVTFNQNHDNHTPLKEHQDNEDPFGLGQQNTTEGNEILETEQHFFTIEQQPKKPNLDLKLNMNFINGNNQINLDDGSSSKKPQFNYASKVGQTHMRTPSPKSIQKFAQFNSVQTSNDQKLSVIQDQANQGKRESNGIIGVTKSLDLQKGILNGNHLLPGQNTIFNFKLSPSEDQSNKGGDKKITVLSGPKSGGISLISGNSPADSSPNPSKAGQSYKSKSFAIVMKEKVQAKQELMRQTTHIKYSQVEQVSLYVFSNNNCFRILVIRMVRYKHFDFLVLILIAIQSIFLALDNPLNDPKSKLVEFLDKSDIAFTVCFVFEALSKIVAQGFLLNGSESYMRNGWNVIDLIVVVLSVISLSINSNTLKIFKVFRLLKVLRPLRVISRNKGLKIGIQALFMAIPNIINVIIISMLFFVIFGIIGVNYFKGALYRCQYGRMGFDQEITFISDVVESLIITKFDCMNWGGAWVNEDQNFDSLPQAMLTLFQMSTTEGWIDVMNNGIDSIDIDYQPKANNNIYWSLFFMMVILFANFLILNLFVGVVVSTFNREKDLLGKNFLLTENQKKWLEQKKLALKFAPQIKMDSHENPLREKIRQMVTSQNFEILTIVCIVLNTSVLSINWYEQPKYIDDILGYINYGFAFIFTIEAGLKIISFGVKQYFREKGNLFDFLIVIVSIISSVVSFALKLDFGASATFIRALRISRILKFISKAKQLKVIFETLIITVPALTNIGGLLLLFLYMFSILGVFLFAEVKLQNNLDFHSNFQSFGSAFMTLIRCSTGEAWNAIMIDTMRPKSILFQCSTDEFDHDLYVQNGYQSNGCGSLSGTAFFMAYVLMVPLVFLNLFIAIILQGFEQTSQKVNNLISDDNLEKFRECWACFDKDGTGFMKLADMNQLLFMLGEPLGWTETPYKGNQPLQDDFLEELHVNTYNDFRDVLFWDVIQALSKVYMIRLSLKRHGITKSHNASKQGTANNSEINGSKELITKSLDNEAEVEDDDDEYGHEDDDMMNEGNSSTKLRIEDENDPLHKEAKMQLRIELEFEHFDEKKQDIMDVEEVKQQEMRLIKDYLIMKDEHFTSAHIKAGRKILQALFRLRNKKRTRQSLEARQRNSLEARLKANQILMEVSPRVKGKRHMSILADQPAQIAHARVIPKKMYLETFNSQESSMAEALSQKESLEESKMRDSQIIEQEFMKRRKLEVKQQLQPNNQGPKITVIPINMRNMLTVKEPTIDAVDLSNLSIPDHEVSKATAGFGISDRRSGGVGAINDILREYDHLGGGGTASGGDGTSLGFELGHDSQEEEEIKQSMVNKFWEYTKGQAQLPENKNRPARQTLPVNGKKHLPAIVGGMKNRLSQGSQQSSSKKASLDTEDLIRDVYKSPNL